MKTDRLYALTLYLLNHGKTSSAKLSKKFEVSPRTIQRDIDSLCEAGVPVIAEKGINGGYYLPDNFKMNTQTMADEDYSNIITALKGLFTATGDKRIAITTEKIAALTKNKNNSIILDFSVLRETDNNQIKLLQDAIKLKKAVKFSYTNAENVFRFHTVEPIALVYQWYAWYLLAYSRVKCDYRTYKLIRMNKLEITESDFIKDHEDAEFILNENAEKTQKYTEIKVKCKKEAKAKAIEYLNGKITAEYENGDCDMTLYVIETEHLWFGTLLSLGDGVVIKEPQYIRMRIKEAAEKIINSY